MSDIADRIVKRMKELNLKQIDLVKHTGASKGTVSNWISGVNTPTGERLVLLADMLKTTSEWLLIGDKQADNISLSNGDNFSVSDLSVNPVPIIGFTQAGHWREAIQEPLGVTYSTYPKKGLFSLYVDGDSMEPLFHEKDLLVVDPMRSPKPGDYVIAQNGEYKTTFKKYRVLDYDENGIEIFELVPLNENHPRIRSDRMPISVIGVVVERVQRF
ncbi:LexA family protein [Acinetobacter sp. c3-l95]|uniref:LexA family protein n=1 Tax=Acinetobacter sp. c3-l95 TaxID=3342804 RepID=UPI0035B8F46B